MTRMTMADALVRKGIHATDWIGPCDGCGTAEADRFAYARYKGSERVAHVLAGCIACGHIFTVAGGWFGDGDWELLWGMTRDDFAEALDAIHTRES